MRRARSFAGKFARAFPSDPVNTVMELQETLIERRERRRPPCPYQADADWERQLHYAMRVPWPCEEGTVFDELFAEVMERLRRQGITVGRGAFVGWGDGEPGLTRAIWCLTRHLQPAKAVETGVGRGVTTRIILEAMERNGRGELWSIDLPPQMQPHLNDEIGAAVPEDRRRRWHLLRGASRRELPKLLKELCQLDLFVHDSRHTEHNLRFELDSAWARLRPGGALVADDIDYNWGFHAFTGAFPGVRGLVCHAEPLQPDPGRLDGRGLFGIVLKQPAGRG
jgi:hypothetical protein